MYNTIVYNQREYNSPFDNTGYKTIRFMRGDYKVSFSVGKKAIVFATRDYKLKFKDF